MKRRCRNCRSFMEKVDCKIVGYCNKIQFSPRLIQKARNKEDHISYYPGFDGQVYVGINFGCRHWKGVQDAIKS